jgi:GNAT superfamily N-acetyltransferase
MKIITVTTAKELTPLVDSSLYADFDAPTLSLHQLDVHCVILDDNEPLARCSLWWKNAPNYQTEQVGLIGHYASRTDEAAKVLLEHACQTLVDKGCTLAIGPMDGTTWRRYRFVTENSLDAPAFFLEPTNPANYPAQWLQSGFTPLAHYTSALQTSLEADPDIEKRLAKLVNTRLAKAGICFRSLNVENLDTELETIFEISLKSFADNFLYTPISKAEFMESYQKLLPFALPELVLFAELNGQAIGYLFGLPDVLQKQRGEILDTFIIKTLAVLPEHMNKGLGTVLTGLVVRRANDLGFKKAIHALMLKTNQSQAISERFLGQMLRRYALFAKSLR